MVMRRITVCVCLATLVGCGAELVPGAGQDTPEDTGAEPSTNCLALEDVINIAPGNATGTSFSGTYEATSIVLLSCVQCPANTVPETDCETPYLTGGELPFVQQDGVLIMEDPDKPVSGGINSDGTFRLGTVATPTRTDGVTTGQALVLLEGEFTGEWILATLTMRLTLNSPDGEMLDGQQVSAVTYERVADP